MNKKVIIWASGIDDLLSQEEGYVGGITVQMMFWALTFVEEKWTVFSFTDHNSRSFMNLNFLKFPQFKYIKLVFESIYTTYILIKIRPDLIIFRGASRTLFILSRLSSLMNIRLVFFGASDVNFIRGKEGITGREYNKILFRKGLEKTFKIVVQNKKQAESLFEEYKKYSITIPNIWISKDVNFEIGKNIIWVGNFRDLKRPEWFISLARNFPQEQFIIAGYPSDKDLYDKCKLIAESLSNISFLGPITFVESEKLFEKAKVLICTSEYEGFPNTFLQAWSRNIPVIATVDPNNLLSEKRMGVLVRNEVELKQSLKYFLKKTDYRTEIKRNISDYFRKNHSPKSHYKSLMAFIYN